MVTTLIWTSELSMQTNELVGVLVGNTSTLPFSQIGSYSIKFPDHAIRPSALYDDPKYPSTSVEDISETSILSDGLANRLVRAVEDQDIAEVKRLLSLGAPISAVDMDNQNLLDIACCGVRSKGQVNLIGILIAGGLEKLNFDDIESRAVLKDCKRELELNKQVKRRKK